MESFEETLYDVYGKPVAYIDYGDENSVFLWNGRAVAYLNGEDIYGFNGCHLGWYVNGEIHDHSGRLVGFNEMASPVIVALEPIKSFKELKPFKALEQFAPFQPFFSSIRSDVDLFSLLMQGR